MPRDKNRPRPFRGTFSFHLPAAKELLLLLLLVVTSVSTASPPVTFSTRIVPDPSYRIFRLPSFFVVEHVHTSTHIHTHVYEWLTRREKDPREADMDGSIQSPLFPPEFYSSSCSFSSTTSSSRRGSNSSKLFPLKRGEKEEFKKTRGIPPRVKKNPIRLLGWISRSLRENDPFNPLEPRTSSFSSSRRKTKQLYLLEQRLNLHAKPRSQPSRCAPHLVIQIDRERLDARGVEAPLCERRNRDQFWT